jgi:hypothetical protein
MRNCLLLISRSVLPAERLRETATRPGRRWKWWHIELDLVFRRPLGWIENEPWISRFNLVERHADVQTVEFDVSGKTAVVRQVLAGRLSG